MKLLYVYLTNGGVDVYNMDMIDHIETSLLDGGVYVNIFLRNSPSKSLADIKYCCLEWAIK